jgi:hypothetical protein
VTGPRMYEQLAAPDKEQLVLHKSGQGVVVDSQSEFVFRQVHDWISARRGSAL